MRPSPLQSCAKASVCDLIILEAHFKSLAHFLQAEMNDKICLAYKT